ncbi:MAG: hypothetical protein AMJ92_03780 [candidate division Zixibacteria bacterium SM23_81]|nr:MAG: hypothetical protein AMJ92_03780 [candidate division Zixibacteria bacterium SM23_81]
MAHAYTPGLRVAERTMLRKERRLPLPGEVLVTEGDAVSADQVVAKTDLPGNVQPINVANLLSIEPADIKEFMLKKEGDEIEKVEPLARSGGLFGLFKNTYKSPVAGTVESVSQVTGQVLIREAPIPVEVKAYIDGMVTEVFPKEGVAVETTASFIQGIFGLGGEAYGELAMASSGPDEVLTESEINEGFRGKVLVGGSLIELPALRKAIKLRAKGVVVGGFSDQDVKEILGYDLGVAITGHEELGTTLVITEGFGKIRMAQRTFQLLKNLEGKKASINGATQIRAGVIRPEVVIPLDETTVKKETEKKKESEGMVIGSQIRIIRQPYFGILATVTDLPAALQKLPTEAKVRVAEVELENGEKVILPRANVELIEK